MATPEISLLAPTRLEAWAARRAVKAAGIAVRVHRVGLGMHRWRPAPGGTVVLCGLAGSLTERVPAGSVVIPSSVSLPSGLSLACDPQLAGALVEAARGLGLESSRGPLLTAPGLLTGTERQRWASTFESVDMESALLGQDGIRFAVVRVILDAPGREISPAWEQPARILVRPWLWPQAIALAAAAPRYALRAGRIAAAALRLLVDP